MIVYSIDKELKNKVCRWFEGISEMVKGLKNGETRELDIIGYAKRAGEYVEKHGITDKQPIDEEKLAELAQEHCLNNGYAGLDEDDFIEDYSLRWRHFMDDIRDAYKAGYYKARE